MTQPGFAPDPGPLSDAELERLGAFLAGVRNPEALSIEGLDGLFCALIACPELVMPSEYYPVIWGGELPDENAFADEDEARTILGLIMRHWNTVARDFLRTGVHVPLFDERDGRGVPGRRWARGYMRGIHMRRHCWRDMLGNEDEGLLFLVAVVAGEVDPEYPTEAISEEQAEEMELQMAAAAARSYAQFETQRRESARAGRERATVRRAEPKVGRNEPCPCGSGRKFKQCCGRAH